MAKLSGFPELLPRGRMVEQHVLDHLRSVFELHGFGSVETRAVEPVAELLRKGEIDKEVYAVRRLQADSEAADDLALHFDLTVPFARYVVENSHELAFPFRRYQIQKVWRGERPQQGRYREFTQADIDIVGRDSLGTHHDVEVARVMAEALAGLPIPRATLQVNNRKLLEGFYRGVGATDPDAVMRVVDKLDKLPADRIVELLVGDAGLDPEQARLCLALAQISGTDVVDDVRALGVEHPLLTEGLTELQQVVDGAVDVEGVTVVADLRIARGLDYYTGTVFETRLEGHEELGSICSGGRYDQLARDNRSTYPGVGISLGVSRLLVPLVTGGLTTDRSVPSVVLVTLLDEHARDESTAIATALRRRGIACEVAPKAQKLGQQIKHAERRGIPFVWFPATGQADGGQPHQVKDLRSGDQVDADPDVWQPAAPDLRPTIIEPDNTEESLS